MKVTPSTVLAAVAVFVALGGLGYAAVSGGLTDAGGAFHGCVSKRSGVLRVVRRGTPCRRGESAISWAQHGVRGARGARGATGAAGAKGDTGAAGPQGIQGVQGPPGAPGQTGGAGTTVLLRLRNGAAGGGGSDGGGGGTNTVITSTTSPTPVTLTSTSFAQVPGQDAFVHGAVTVDVPPASDCVSGSGAGVLTVTVLLDNVPAGRVQARAGSTPDPRTIPLGWQVGNTDGTDFASGVYPYIGTSQSQNHTIAATVTDDCTVTGTTHFSISLLKLEIIGAGT